VLRSVGEITTRIDDSVARYGGEEFAVLLRGSGLAEAVESAERVRKAIAEARVVHDSQVITITASFGVAAVRGRDATTPAALIQAADRRLYSAKERGRNRVESGA
jgi:diguanylate cyclase (GGDEF)-like protein